jgi:hypothetical protein
MILQTNIDAMADAIGVPVHIGEWVAFYKSPNGKAMFGRVVEFNMSTMVIEPLGKSRTYLPVTKSSIQVVKIPKELIEQQKVIVTDALGVEIKVGDWVMMTGCTSRYIRSCGDYNGKMAFGEIVKLNNGSVDVKIRNKKTLLKKLSSQIVKVSEEQLTLHWFTV